MYKKIDVAIEKATDIMLEKGLHCYDKADFLQLPIYINSSKTNTFFGRINKLLIQILISLFPNNIRKLFKIKKNRIAQAEALLILADCIDNTKLVKNKIDALDSLKIKTESGEGFGLPFPVYKNDKYFFNIPYAHSTIWCLNAYIEAYKNHPTKDLRLKIGKLISYLDKDLNYAKEAVGLSVSYTAYDKDKIINVSAELSAAFLNFSKNVEKTPHVEKKATDLMKFVISNQDSDGGFPYKPGPNGVYDFYHSTMVLRSILAFMDLQKKYMYLNHFIIGNRFLQDKLFNSGYPKRTISKKYPVDTYSLCESLMLNMDIINFQKKHNQLKKIDIKKNDILSFCGLLIDDFQLKNGQFILQKIFFIKNKLYSLRWSHAYCIYVLKRAKMEFQNA